MSDKRESNIELLRILTMCGVIILHYNNPLIGGGIANADGLNLYVLYFLESLCICAVNLFILISGYFMCTNNKRSLDKALRLLIQVIIFNECIYLLRILTGHASFSIKSAIGNLVPANYFVILYVTLYFVSPLINKAIDSVPVNELKKVFYILIALFSIWPTIVDFSGEVLQENWTGLSTIGMYGSQWGYSIVNFCLMYFCGAYIRKTEKIIKKSCKECIIKITVLTIIIMVWAIVNDYIGYGTERSAWEYCNPLIIIQAMNIFRLFKNMSIHSKVINELAKAAFTVFLIMNLFLTRLSIEKIVTENIVIMLLHLLATIVCIYLICWIIYKVYDIVTSRLFAKIGNRFRVLEKDIYGD